MNSEKSIDAEALVIVCMLRKDTLYEDIMKRLYNKGFNRIIHMQDIQTEGSYQWLFKKQNLILYADKQKIKKHQCDIDYVRMFLEDEGKKVYDEVFKYIDSDFKGYIESYPILEQYWAYDLFTKNEEEIVFDCGAFDGTVMREFINRNQRFKAYYAFEPDKSNAKRILQTDTDKIHVIQKALAEVSKGTVSMRNYMNMNSVIIDDGDFYVDCICLDDMDIMPTFIKIDVEGYEKKVIKGSLKLLKKCRPIIACAIYHSLEQLWEIPAMLIGMTENYSYYIRSYLNLYETVFYAIPNERKK